MTDLLSQMRRNPAGDWTMRDVERLCTALGIRCRPPTGGGSHYKVSHPSRPEILTIRARRPIKAFYIRELVRFAAAVGGQSGST